LEYKEFFIKLMAIIYNFLNPRLSSFTAQIKTANNKNTVRPNSFSRNFYNLKPFLVSNASIMPDANDI